MTGSTPDSQALKGGLAAAAQTLVPLEQHIARKTGLMRSTDLQPAWFAQFRLARVAIQKTRDPLPSGRAAATGDR